MGLENIGIEGNVRGSIEVNENFQTIHPHIYAVGDVIGFPSLASAASTPMLPSRSGRFRHHAGLP